jgi:hypothetical protein
MPLVRVNVSLDKRGHGPLSPRCGNTETKARRFLTRSVLQHSRYFLPTKEAFDLTPNEREPMLGVEVVAVHTMTKSPHLH